MLPPSRGGPFPALRTPLEVPHLIDIQRRSFEALTDPKEGLLRETINDVSPIEDYTGNLAIVFGDFRFDEPHALDRTSAVRRTSPTRVR